VVRLVLPGAGKRISGAAGGWWHELTVAEDETEDARESAGCEGAMVICRFAPLKSFAGPGFLGGRELAGPVPAPGAPGPG
jgi:hypothetical protein